MNDYDPTAPKQLLNRYQEIWHQRLAIGLSLDHRFQFVDAAIVLCKGCGKSLRHQWTEYRRQETPESLVNQCLRLTQEEGDLTLSKLRQVQTDLSEVLAVAASRVIALSGKAKSRLLTIGIQEPGIWIREFDGNRAFQAMIDPEYVAAKSGLTVIDAFPARDVAYGGNGDPVDLVALWLLFADRDPKIAVQPRIVLWMGKSCRLAYLPASDGLDDEFPQVQYREIEFSDSLARWLAGDGVEIEPSEWFHENAPGLSASVPKGSQGDARDVDSADSQSPIDASADPPVQFWELARVVRRQIEKWSDGAGQAHQTVRQYSDVAYSEKSPRIYLFAPRPTEDLLKQLVLLDSPDNRWEFADVRQQFDCGSLAATVPAVLGLMSMDQMPSSLPGLTGTFAPRMLGRITPGAPANWRQVVINMADFQPPAMKLRDVI